MRFNSSSSSAAWWSHPLILGLATLATIVISVTLWASRRSPLPTIEPTVLDQEISEIASEVDQLEQQVTLASSSAEQERLIRDQLLMQKPGEYVVVMKAENNQATLLNNSNITQLTPWQEWQELLL